MKVESEYIYYIIYNKKDKHFLCVNGIISTEYCYANIFNSCKYATRELEKWLEKDPAKYKEFNVIECKKTYTIEYDD